MSARGNCYDNAVVESFFGLMKRERVNRTCYLTRDEAKADVFDYIERFYNRKRRHGYLGNISPAAFEERNQNKFQGVEPIHQNHLNAIARRLNERPRKTLGYYSPAEKFAECVASIG
jgi:transposase InsO family protein